MALYVGHHCWLTKKILDFWWSKKAKILLETISFWRNISITIFKFFPFLYTMKACQWNLINFSTFANALIRKEKKNLRSSQLKKYLRKIGPKTCFTTGFFLKSINMIINHFFCFASTLAAQFLPFLISGWRKKYQKEK